VIVVFVIVFMGEWWVFGEGSFCLGEFYIVSVIEIECFEGHFSVGKDILVRWDCQVL